MNDLKTLYNAYSDKDELAQIAEKLGIEGNANLAAVLEGIVELTGSLIPNLGTLSDGQEITSEVIDIISQNPIIKANGYLWIITNTIPPQDDWTQIEYKIRFTRNLRYIVDDELDAAYWLVFSGDFDGRWSARFLEL